MAAFLKTYNIMEGTLIINALSPYEIEGLEKGEYNAIERDLNVDNLDKYCIYSEEGLIPIDYKKIVLKSGKKEKAFYVEDAAIGFVEDEEGNLLDSYEVEGVVLPKMYISYSVIGFDK